MGDKNVTARITSEASYDSVFYPQGAGGGNLLVDGTYITDGGLSICGTVSGGYFLTLDNDNYTFVPGRALVCLKKGIVDAEGGIFYRQSTFGFEQLLGGKLFVGNSNFNAKIYGGRTIDRTWKDDGQTDWYLGNNIVGVMLAGGIPLIHADLGLEHEMLPGGEQYDTTLTYLVTGRPLQFMRPFTAGKFLLIRDSYSVDAGAHFDIIKDRLGLTAKVQRSNLPPLFEDIEGMPKLEETRGELALTFRPIPTIALLASAQVGELSFAEKAGISLWDHAGLYAVHRHDQSYGTDAFGGMVNGNIPTGHNTGIELYAVGLYEDESSPLTAMDDGVMFQGGGRFVWATDWFSAAVGGGYTRMPLLEQDSIYGGVTIDFGGGTERDKEHNRPLHASDSPQSPALMHGMATMFRAFGKFMKEIAGGFSHLYHLTDNEIKDANNGEAFSCGSCHSDNPLFDVKKESLEACSNCHTDKAKFTSIFEKLSRVGHPGGVPPEDCGECHADMAKLEAPTGGAGTIITNPHGTETWAIGETGWKDHGRSLDASCNICHTGKAQYKEHVVASCNECHTPDEPKQNISQRQHPNGWKAMHIMEAKIDPSSCNTCHDPSEVAEQNSCQACHQTNLPSEFHHGTDFMKYDGNGEMRHGKLAKETKGKACAPCHSNEAVEDKPSCGRCH